MKPANRLSNLEKAEGKIKADGTRGANCRCLHMGDRGTRPSRLRAAKES